MAGVTANVSFDLSTVTSSSSETAETSETSVTSDLPTTSSSSSSSASQKTSDSSSATDTTKSASTALPSSTSLLTTSSDKATTARTSLTPMTTTIYPITGSSEPSSSASCPKEPSCSLRPGSPSRSQVALLEVASLYSNARDCIEPCYILLWFTFYNIFAVIASLALGSRQSRAIIAHLTGSSDFGKSFPDSSRSLDKRLNYLSVIFSLILQVGATVGTAFIFTRDDPSASPWHMFALWTARPLATPLVIYFVMINPSSYAFQAAEITYVDTLLSLISLVGFGTVAHATTGGGPLQVSIAQAGSAIGILANILFLHLLYKVRPSYIFVQTQQPSEDRLQVDWERLNPLRLKIAGAWAFVLHVLRYMASWLLWVGVLQTNPEAFCPSTGALFEVMALLICVPILDNVLRAYLVGGRGQKLADGRRRGLEEAFDIEDVLLNLVNLERFRVGCG
ncbi:uncharacterized protein KY384_007898 [Bacidia gigantensis]|uniref:uncharacterized protein n=1 Tax=Bacidia gigantensis TaxID=2732470 RepID=UPI001D04038C|nr:uncharacterized protein KY384_007898 [Bacidia gigantensis]KAG8527744.1 hypothetical protein KY384_007898 [Bacidia gigantensis]